MRTIPTRLLATALLCLAGPLAAQTVQGTLRTATDSTAVPGALVLLLDTAGVEQGRTVSYASGRYTLRASRPGTYRLEVLRIGALPFTSDSFALAAGQTRSLPLILPRSPVVLTELVVTGKTDCRLYPDSQATTSAVWQEVRKALALTVETMEHGPYRFATDVRRLYYDRNMRLIRGNSVPGQMLEKWPVVTLPPDRLAEHGYIQPTEEGMVYYGIDPAVLSSASFLAGHCFHLVRKHHDPSLIGLAFEPVKHSSLPDVEGALWLSRDNAELRYLEFSYRNTARWIPRKETGGRLDFMRLANGAWLVREWWMRAPRGPRRTPSGRLGVAGWTIMRGRVTEIRDENGRVLQTLDALPDR